MCHGIGNVLLQSHRIDWQHSGNKWNRLISVYQPTYKIVIEFGDPMMSIHCWSLEHLLILQSVNVPVMLDILIHGLEYFLASARGVRILVIDERILV